MRNAIVVRLMAVGFVVGLFLWGPDAVAARGRPLRVALSGDLMPLHAWSKNKAVGFEAELAQAIGKNQGRKVEFVNLDKLEKSSFAALHDEDVHISLNSIASDAEVDAGIALSQPYLTLHFRVAAKAKTEIQDPSTFVGKVGVLDKSARDLMKKRMPEAKFVPQDSIKAAVAALMRGELQLIAHDGSVLSQAIKGTTLKLLPQPFGDLNLSIAARSADIAKYDKALSKLAPTIAKLQKKWFKVSAPVDVDSLMSAWPKSWVALKTQGRRQVIPVRCDNNPDRIELSQRDGGWYLEFGLGEDSVEGRVGEIEKLAAGHFRLHYLRQSIELRYRAGAKTAQWGKSSELWKGAWRTFADAKNEKTYRAVREKKCP